VRTPERFYEHFLRFPASLVFTLSFCGKDLDEVQRVLADFVQDMNPGVHFVDMFMVLDLLPDFSSPYALLALTKSVGLIEYQVARRGAEERPSGSGGEAVRLAHTCIKSSVRSETQ
jgi:hypothetical protein